MCQGLKQQLMNSLLFFGIYSLQPLRMFDKSYSFVAFRQYYYYKPAITSIMIERKISSLSLSIQTRDRTGQVEKSKKKREQGSLCYAGVRSKKKEENFLCFFSFSTFLLCFFAICLR
jgi:hypothetical protein